MRKTNLCSPSCFQSRILLSILAAQHILKQKIRHQGNHWVSHKTGKVYECCLWLILARLWTLAGTHTHTLPHKLPHSKNKLLHQYWQSQIQVKSGSYSTPFSSPVLCTRQHPQHKPPPALLWNKTNDLFWYMGGQHPPPYIRCGITCSERMPALAWVDPQSPRAPPTCQRKLWHQLLWLNSELYSLWHLYVRCCFCDAESN